MSRDKTPKGTAPPFSKTIRDRGDADRWQSERVTMLYSTFDHEGKWGFTAISECNWQEILKKLEQFQTMTWGEVLAASGGRRHGTNHHDLEVTGLTRLAKDRLRDLEAEEDFIFSFRLDSTLRIYGLRRGSKFSALWVDPWHGDNSRAVCPTREK